MAVVQVQPLGLHLRAVHQLVQQGVIGIPGSHPFPGQGQRIIPIHGAPALVIGNPKPCPLIVPCGNRRNQAVCLLVTDICLVGNHSLMERPHLLQQRRVLLRVKRIAVAGHVYFHRSDLAGLRHPGGNSKHVKVQRAAHSHAAKDHRAQANPASPEHPQGFTQQHGGAIVPNDARHHQAHGHGQQVVIAAALEAVPEQLIEQLSAQQRAECRYTIPEYRPQPAHRHHVSGGFAAAPAVHHVSKAQKHHSHQGIDTDHPDAVQVDRGQNRFLICIGSLISLNLAVGSIHTHAAHQRNGRRKPFGNPRVAAVKPKNKPLGKGGDQPIQQNRQKMQQEIQHWKRKDIPRNKRHKGGAGKVEKALTDHHENRRQQAPNVKAAIPQGYRHTQRAGNGIGQQHHRHAGEEVCDKQPLSPDRQRVHQAHAPGAVQVAPHHHGAEDGISQRDHRQRARHHRIVHVRKLCRRGNRPRPAANKVQQQRQGKQHAHKGRQPPQRPESGQILAQQRGIKARYP